MKKRLEQYIGLHLIGVGPTLWLQRQPKIRNAQYRGHALCFSMKSPAYFGCKVRTVAFHICSPNFQTKFPTIRTYTSPIQILELMWSNALSDSRQLESIAEYNFTPRNYCHASSNGSPIDSRSPQFVNKSWDSIAIRDIQPFGERRWKQPRFASVTSC